MHFLIRRAGRVAALLALFWTTIAVAQLRIVDNGPNPLAGPYSVSQTDTTATGAPGAGGSLIATQDYTDNGGPPGQTFTVSSPSSFGLLLLHGGNDAGLYGNASTVGIQFMLQIGTVNTSTGALTQLDLETSPRIQNAQLQQMAGDYVVLLPVVHVPLNPGTTYFWSLASVDGGWFGLTHSLGDVYSGGTAFNNDLNTTDAGNADPKFTFNGFVSPRPYDFTFSIGPVPAPEPAASGAVLLVGAALFRRKRADGV
jgi:hypothetical protein